ncbi:PREDICTED: uncharacterized protein LOC105313862 [Amphimedon queenslandica]|uniref:Btz domain-containing protein n=1 Tax=Amphimedon queenslandica TaxID=400682 RepID=A0A1X7U6W0_AMPQE|nr:PREDICTED: uncharacterized protein LOC105313862 [Amphimedon queenslandica]|eukprot:XP_011405925.1 PREDICTED: uncharacterized protein LOC105313862 [Amphimedon queenslandica]
MTSAYRARSPIRENKTHSSSSFGGRRENWRLRQERPNLRDDSFMRPRGGHYRGGERERGPYRGGRQNWRERSRSESETYRERGRREWRGGDNPEQEQNQENDARISDDLAGDQPGRGGQGGRYRRRQSSEAETESINRPLVLNPTDVPRAERYFTHDDRLTAPTRRPRSVTTPTKWGHDGFEKMNPTSKPTYQPNRRTRIDSTPLKWDHDMFEKIKQEDEKEQMEVTPPPEHGSEIPRTRSVITVPNTRESIVFNEEGDGVE